jgi:peroxiredoxin family protein
VANKLRIICVSGTRERLQMAAMIASVAAASGDDVSVFLSMNALPYFVKGRASDPPSEGEVGALMGQGVPPFRQLFALAAEFGTASLLPCSMAVDLMKLDAGDLQPELGAPTGLARFLTDAEGAQLLTF